MNLCSASTAAAHVAAGCCSRVLELAVADDPVRYETSRGRKAPRPRSRSRRANAGILQAWSALGRIGRGGCATPVKWIPKSPKSFFFDPAFDAQMQAYDDRQDLPGFAMWFGGPNRSGLGWDFSLSATQSEIKWPSEFRGERPGRHRRSFMPVADNFTIWGVSSGSLLVVE